MGVRDFRELRVYQTAIAGATRIYEESKAFPPDERYSLTSQVRRSSRSVCANLAEAWDKRSYPAVFASKLSDSAGEAAETITWIEIASACRLLTADIGRPIIASYDEIRAQLRLMIKDRHRWCNPL